MTHTRDSYSEWLETKGGFWSLVLDTMCRVSPQKADRLEIKPNRKDWQNV